MRYEKESVTYTEAEVLAALPTLSLPETLLPEHVAEFGFTLDVEPGPPAPTAEELAARLQAGFSDIEPELPALEWPL